ncbi:MAG: NADAR family protein [Cyanobacteria bacterium J06649_11]
MEKKKLSDKEIFGLNRFYLAKRDGLDWNFEEKLFNEAKSYNVGGVIRKRIEKNNGNEEFTFFWETRSPFSQWHKSKFIGSIYSIVNKELLPVEFTEELEFSSAEQFMMYNKALLFLDREAAFKIIKTSNPRKQKALGRQVENFDEEIWNFARSEIVLRGNRLKFHQNEDLKYKLLETKGTTLVESSPDDKIWGIGLRESDERVMKRDTWQGLNLLGEILTEIRDEIIRKEKTR